MYEKILARSFSRHEQQKFKYAAFFTLLLVVASLCTMVKPYFGQLALLNLGLSMNNELKNLITQDANKSENKGNFTVADEDLHPAKNTLQPVLDQPGNITTFQQALNNQAENTKKVSEAVDDGEASNVVISEVFCNFTLPRSNSCTINGDVRVSGINGTVQVPTIGNNTKSWKLKPYARKTDATAMSLVREWSVKYISEPQELPVCSVNHSVPAIIFSTGGYNGNHFHDSTDTLIPLFLSAKRFNGEVKFLITNYKIAWLNKYRKILKKLSKYEIMDIDKEWNIHCFPKVILGLTSQKEFNVDPSMPPYSSLKDYTSFIRGAFSLPRSNSINLSTEKSRKPILLIISRKETRRLTNIGNVVEIARKLGYKVIVDEGDNRAKLAKFAETTNSCDVLLGVHGAGLTNIVFLPENAVFIQIVPLALEYIANTDFGLPAKDMNLNYLDYHITKEESSLTEQYPADHIVFSDPFSLQQQGWDTFKAIFLEKQDVKVDIMRLQTFLVKALDLLRR